MTTKLVCPSCDAGFKVPATAIPEEGRTVRCAKCKHEWLATPEHLVTQDESTDEAAPPKETSEASPETQNTPETEAKTEESESVVKIETEAQAPTTDEPAPIEEDDAADDADKADAIDMAKSLKDAAIQAKIMDISPRASKVKTASAQSTRFTKRLMFGSIAMTLLFLATAFYSMHHSIRTSSSAANVIYNAMGYPDSNGIVLAKLEYNKIPMFNKIRYQIKGAIVNTLEEDKLFPTLRMRIVDEEGKTLKIREGKLDGTLKQGEPFHFSEEFDGSTLAKDHALIVEIGNPLELSDRE